MAFLTDRKRATGMGSAKEGTHHFISMQISAVALLILTPLFILNFGTILGSSHDVVLAHYAKPYPAVLTALTLIVGFWHFRHGAQVLVEDYTHGLMRKALILLVIFVSYASIAAGLFALVRLAL